MSYLPARRRLAAAAGLLLLAVPLSACDVPFTGGGAPEAVATVPALKGTTTEIKLDKGFTGALEKLGLTPGVIGKAKLKDGSLIFPITGGNVTVFKQGEVSPYVIGQIQHASSGLSLSAGGTTVDADQLQRRPGASVVYGDVRCQRQERRDRRAPLQPRRPHAQAPADQGQGGDPRGHQGADLRPPRPTCSNKTFGTKAVKQGLLVGVAKITVDTK